MTFVNVLLAFGAQGLQPLRLSQGLKPLGSVRFFMHGAVALVMLTMMLVGPSPATAQMPSAVEMSGRPLPSAEVPPGSLQVRVMRESFEGITSQPVSVSIDGESRMMTTGDDGRLLVSGLRVGSTVRVSTVVEGTRLESQSIPIGLTGMMVALVVEGPVDPNAPPPPAAAPAVSGSIVLGPESRVIVELSENALRVFYIMDVVNALDTPVDIGGPLIFDLPREARGTAMLPESTPRATANGPRVIVTGPFAPGITPVQAAFELPYRGPTAQLEQVWPATLQQLTLLVEQHGSLDITSPQMNNRNIVSSNGMPLIFGAGPAIMQGQSLVVDFTGLPHHPTWPQSVALLLGMAIIGWGIWGAATAPRARA